MHLSNSVIRNVPQNGIVNTGALEVHGLTVENAGEYGISSGYNAPGASLTGSDIQITNVGIVSISDGIYNAGTANISNVTVSGA
jgi:hypothetical protein